MLDWNWIVAAALLAVATVLIISFLLIFLRPNHHRKNIISACKPFHWIDHPDHSINAINRGWAAFAFADATQSAGLEHSSYSGNGCSDINLHRLRLCPSLFARKGEANKNENGNENEDVPSPLAPAIHDLKTALPLPGPPFSGFPQEVYLEITFLPINNNRNNNSNNKKIIINSDNNKIVVNTTTNDIDNNKIVVNKNTNNISNNKIINNNIDNIDNPTINVNNINIPNNNNKINKINNTDTNINTNTNPNNNNICECTPCVDVNTDINIGVEVTSTFSSFSEGERAKLITNCLALPSDKYYIDNRRNSLGSHVVITRTSESGRKSCSARVQHSAEGLDEISGKGCSNKHVDQSVLPPPIIAVGLTSIDAATFRLPGTYPGSIGFHSDGHIYLNGVEYMGEPFPNVSFTGKKWSILASTTPPPPPPPPTTVVGIGFDPKWKKVFFTLNGEHICEVVVTGSGDAEFGGPLYPTIASNLEANVSVNFGQTPFEYTPCNSHRIYDPSSSRVVNLEDSEDLFSMGRLDSQYLNYLNGLDFPNEDPDSDLFEIILDGKQP